MYRDSVPLGGFTLDSSCFFSLKVDGFIVSLLSIEFEFRFDLFCLIIGETGANLVSILGEDKSLVVRAGERLLYITFLIFKAYKGTCL